MDNKQEERLVEIRFYLVIQQLFGLCPDADVLQATIETIAMYHRFNTLVVQRLAIEMLSGMKKPMKEEVAVLLWSAGCTFRKLSAYTKLSNKRIYEMVDRYKADPYPFRVCCTAKERQELQGFMDGLKIFKDLDLF